MTTIQDRQLTNKPEGIEQHSASVPDLVAARARKDPDALALMQESHPLTYGWLDRQANRVAAHLGTLGVGRDVVVGLCLPRSFEMVIGALGIMKAGGAYLPMDPSYPSERLAFMLRDARAPVLITSRELGAPRCRTSAALRCTSILRPSPATLRPRGRCRWRRRTSPT